MPEQEAQSVNKVGVLVVLGMVIVAVLLAVFVPAVGEVAASVSLTLESWVRISAAFVFGLF